MRSYPCIPYENFVNYAILISDSNDQIIKFLTEQELPPIEPEYLDLRRETLAKQAPKGIKPMITGSFYVPQEAKAFKMLMRWLVRTKLILPFVYFNPKYIVKQYVIHPKVIREVFLIQYHPYLRRVHNCSTFFVDCPYFFKHFPLRCSQAAFDWYSHIFFNPKEMESEGDWTYYFSKLDPAEARLYDACLKGELNYVIWLLGGLPDVTLEDLQKHIQAIAFWKTVDKTRGDLYGTDSASRDLEEVRQWTKLGIEVVKTCSEQKALPAPSYVNEEILEGKLYTAEEVDPTAEFDDLSSKEVN